MIKSIRFYITEKCNAKCVNCFNRDTRRSTSMTLEKYEVLCKYFSSLDVKSCKIMGGEPTIHHDFLAIMEMSQHYFDYVGLFTNAIDKSILSYNPRSNDIVTYNFKFSKVLTKEKLLIDKPGKRHLEIQINEETDTDSLIEEIKRIYELSCKKVVVALTLDCTENIFEKRSSILKNYKIVQDFLIKENIPHRTDHKVPICFSYNSPYPATVSASTCRMECAGLIDSQYNLRFCNQFPEILTSIFEPSGTLIEPEIMYNYLKNKRYDIQSSCLSKICKDCILYDKYCNGGCFVAKQIITRDCVFEHTELPIE